MSPHLPVGIEPSSAEVILAPREARCPPRRGEGSLSSSERCSSKVTKSWGVTPSTNIIHNGVTGLGLTGNKAENTGRKAVHVGFLQNPTRVRASPTEEKASHAGAGLCLTAGPDRSWPRHKQSAELFLQVIGTSATGLRWFGIPPLNSPCFKPPSSASGPPSPQNHRPKEEQSSACP